MKKKELNDNFGILPTKSKKNKFQALFKTLFINACFGSRPSNWSKTLQRMLKLKWHTFLADKWLYKVSLKSKTHNLLWSKLLSYYSKNIFFDQKMPKLATSHLENF